MDDMTHTIKQIIGKIPTNILEDVEEIWMFFSDGSRCKLYHSQQCCESVVVEDVNGDWNDLIGHPLLVAEERTDEGGTWWGHQTWTCYTFRSVGGSVDVRWLGESNGYSSESVDFVYEEGK